MQYQRLFKGIGSILNITPNVDFRGFIPKQTPTERMRGHFERVGKNLSRSMNRFEVKYTQKK